jgi:hypothetical protein
MPDKAHSLDTMPDEKAYVNHLEEVLPAEKDRTKLRQIKRTGLDRGVTLETICDSNRTSTILTCALRGVLF